VFNRLRVLAEHLKRELSTREEHTVSVDDLAGASRGQMPAWRFRMTRAQIEAASLALIERTFAVCGQALAAASAQPRELDRIILVGGATRMPIVSRKVAEFFGRPAIVRINPDEVVALGAAIQATLLDRSRPKDGRAMAHPRVEVTSVIEPSPSAVSLPLVVAAASVSAATRGFDPSSLESSAAAAAQFLPGPTSKPLVFEVPRELASPSAGRARVPPPLPARGRARPPPPLPEGAPSPIPRAALPVEPQLAPPPTPRAAPVVPPSPPLLLIDVTPLDLGVETAGGFADVLIDANTPVPCDRTRAFATASDQQTLVTIRVAQGRSKRFAENTFLGELELTEIPPAPRGEMQIAVTFEIDVDGILKVRARDVKTGRETAARLQLIGAQTEPSEIEAMQARQLARSIAPVVRRG